jgi:hypothetical protein
MVLSVGISNRRSKKRSRSMVRRGGYSTWSGLDEQPVGKNTPTEKETRLESKDAQKKGQKPCAGTGGKRRH